MKILIKNNLKGLVKNKLFLLLLLLISVIMGLLFSYLYYGNMPMKNCYEDELNSCNLEEIRLLPNLDLSDEETNEIVDKYQMKPEDLAEKSMNELIKEYHVDLIPYYDDRISELKKEYNLETTLLERKYVVDEQQTLYMTYKEGDLDKVVIVEGTENLNNGEILLSVQYANKKQLAAGDTFCIDEKDYQIVGLYYQPSESLIYNSKYAKNMNTESNGGVCMTKHDFDEVAGDSELMYLGRFSKEQSHEELDQIIQDMMDDEDIVSVQKSNELMNYETLRSNFDTSLAFMMVGIVIFLVTIILIMFQIIENQFNQYKKCIGILKAMGFSECKIAVSFFVFVMPICIGFFIGLLLGYTQSFGYSRNYLNTFNYIVPDITFDYVLTLELCIAITVLMVLVCFFRGMKKVSEPVLNLMANRIEKKMGRVSEFIGGTLRRIPFITRMKLEFMSQNVGRIFVMLIMTGISFVMLNFAAAIWGLTTNPIKELQTAIQYEYVYTYDDMQDKREGDDKAIVADMYILAKGDTKINSSVVCYFVEEDFSFMKLLNQDVNLLQKLENGNSIIVSKKMAYNYGLQEGDVISIKGKDKKSYDVTIQGINPLAYDSAVYMNISDVKHYLEHVDDQNYNVEFASEELNIADDCNYSVKRKNEVIDNMKSVINGSMSMIPILVVLTVILVMSISLLLAYLNIKDNRHNIAVFSIVGYKTSTIKKMVINVYSIVIIFGGLIGCLVIERILVAISNYINQVTDIYIELNSYTWMWVIACVALYVVYRISIVIMSIPISRIKVNEIIYE